MLQHTCRLHRKRSAAAIASGCENIPPICWRFVCCGLEAKEAAALDDMRDMVKKMPMPESAKDLDARSMPRMLTDNLLVESASGLTEDEVRSAVNTWLRVKDNEEVLRAAVEL